MFILDRPPVAHSIARSLPTARGPGFDPSWFPGFLPHLVQSGLRVHRASGRVQPMFREGAAGSNPTDVCHATRAPYPLALSIACRLGGRSSGCLWRSWSTFRAASGKYFRKFWKTRFRTCHPGKILKRPDRMDLRRGVLIGLGSGERDHNSNETSRPRPKKTDDPQPREHEHQGRHQQ